MEFKWLAILLAILYILPEILKKRRPKKYEYPHQVPQPVPEPTPEYPAAQEAVLLQPKAAYKETHFAGEISKPIELINFSENADAQQEAFSQSMVLNGIIFAEILQPPRALRPLEQRRSCLR